LIPALDQIATYGLGHQTKDVLVFCLLIDGDAGNRPRPNGQAIFPVLCPGMVRDPESAHPLGKLIVPAVTDDAYVIQLETSLD
jgi:hypothetical protein